MDELSERFFEEGLRQETSEHVVESPPPYRGSRKRIPRKHRTPIVMLGVVLSLAAGTGWWMGWLPAPSWLAGSELRARITSVTVR
jgi:hypothetical protein